jgi:hypothetical protein
MIAAIALANDLTVVTRNQKEFVRVVGLKCVVSFYTVASGVFCFDFRRFMSTEDIVSGDNLDCISNSPI